MRISQPEPGGVWKIAGDLDIGAAEALRQALFDALQRDKSVTVDLTGVDSCDTAALQLLYAARQGARRSHQSFRVAAMSAAILETGAALGLPLAELTADLADRGNQHAL
jgi:anti-anti-sigma factor